MPKPILIVRVPNNSNKSVEYLNSVFSILGKKISDWHVIPFICGSVDKIEFESFNSTNATDIEIEDLKKEILKQINNDNK
jgi:hypothetical protein